MRAMKRTLAVALVLVASVAEARTQNVPRAITPAPAPMKGFRADFFARLDEVEGKLLQLAEATPAEKYGWRTGPEVRSISEVYMHVAGGNYFLATFLGVKAPARNGDMEKKVTAKPDVIAELKK